MTLIGKQNDGEVPKGGHLIQGKDGSGNAQDVAVDTDGNLQVDIVSGASAGTQYTEGDTDASITGTAIMWEDTSDILRAVSAAKPLPVTNATLIAGEDLTNDVLKTEQRFSATVISTATTTVVKAGAGLLRAIIITGGVAGTVIIYDNTAGSGTKIGDFDPLNAPETFIFDASFATGLTVVTGGATKLTVLYR